MLSAAVAVLAAFRGLQGVVGGGGTAVFPTGGVLGIAGHGDLRLSEGIRVFLFLGGKERVGGSV